MIFAEINFVEKIRRGVRNEDFPPSVARRKREVVKDFQNEKAFRRFRDFTTKSSRNRRIAATALLALLALFIFKSIIAKSDGSSQEKQS